MKIIFAILLTCFTGFAFGQDEVDSDANLSAGIAKTDEIGFVNAPSGDGGELGKDTAAKRAEEGDEGEKQPDRKHK